MSIEPSQLICLVNDIESHQKSGDLSSYEIKNLKLVKKPGITNFFSKNKGDPYTELKATVLKLEINAKDLTENPPEGVESLFLYFPSILHDYQDKYLADTGIDLFNQEVKTADKIKELNRVREKLQTTKLLFELLKKINHPITQKNTDTLKLYEAIFTKECVVLDTKDPLNLFHQIDKLSEILRHQIALLVFSEGEKQTPELVRSRSFREKLQNFLRPQISEEEKRGALIEEQKRKLQEVLPTSRVEPKHQKEVLKGLELRAQIPRGSTKTAEELAERQKRIKQFLQETGTTDLFLINAFIDLHLNDLFPLFEKTTEGREKRSSTENEVEQKTLMKQVNRLQARTKEEWLISIDSKESDIAKRQKEFVPKLLVSLFKIEHDLLMSSEYSIEDTLSNAQKKYTNETVHDFKKELLKWVALHNNEIAFDPEYNEIKARLKERALLLGCDETTIDAYFEKIENLITSTLFEKNKCFNAQYILQNDRTQDIHSFTEKELKELLDSFFDEEKILIKESSPLQVTGAKPLPTILTTTMRKNKELYEEFNRKLKGLKSQYVIGKELNHALNSLREEMKKATQNENGRFFGVETEERTLKIERIMRFMSLIASYGITRDYYTLQISIETYHYGGPPKKDFDQDLAYINETFSKQLTALFPKEDPHFNTIRESYLAHLKLHRLSEKEIAEIKKVLEGISPFTKTFLVNHHKKAFLFINDLDQMITTAIAIKNAIDQPLKGLKISDFFEANGEEITDLETFKANLKKQGITLNLSPQKFDDFLFLMKELVNTQKDQLILLKNDLTPSLLSQKIGVTQSTPLKNFLRSLSDEEAKSFLTTNKIGKEAPQIEELIKILPLNDGDSKSTKLKMTIQSFEIQKNLNSLQKKTLEERRFLRNTLQELKKPLENKGLNDFQENVNRFVSLLILLEKTEDIKKFLIDNNIPNPETPLKTKEKVIEHLFDFFEFDREDPISIDFNLFKDPKAAQKVFEKHFPLAAKEMIQEEVESIQKLMNLEETIDTFEKLNQFKERTLKAFNAECNLTIKDFELLKKIYSKKEKIKTIQRLFQKLENKTTIEPPKNAIENDRISEYLEKITDLLINQNEIKLNELNLEIRETLKVFISKGKDLSKDKEAFKETIETEITQLKALIDDLYDLIRSKIVIFNEIENFQASIDAMLNQTNDRSSHIETVLKPTFKNIIKNLCSGFYRSEAEMKDLMETLEATLNRQKRVIQEKEAFLNYLTYKLKDVLLTAPKLKDTPDEYKQKIDSFVKNNSLTKDSIKKPLFLNFIEEEFKYLLNDSDKTINHLKEAIEKFNTDYPSGNLDELITSITLFLYNRSQDDLKNDRDPTVKNIDGFMTHLKDVLSKAMTLLEADRWKVLKNAKTLMNDLS